MATKRQAETVSLTSLSKSIDRAVELAAKRYGIEVENDNVILNWEFIGRQVREATVAEEAQMLAAASSVARAVPKAQPVVTRFMRRIFIGIVYRPSGVLRI